MHCTCVNQAAAAGVLVQLLLLQLLRCVLLLRLHAVERALLLQLHADTWPARLPALSASAAGAAAPGLIAAAAAAIAGLPPKVAQKKMSALQT